METLNMPDPSIFSGATNLAEAYYDGRSYLCLFMLVLYGPVNNEMMSNKIQKLSSFKSNENIHKREDGSYYVVSANKASSVTL